MNWLLYLSFSLIVWVLYLSKYTYLSTAIPKFKNKVDNTSNIYVNGPCLHIIWEFKNVYEWLRITPQSLFQYSIRIMHCILVISHLVSTYWYLPYRVGIIFIDNCTYVYNLYLWTMENLPWKINRQVNLYVL